jgi:hypothetical protein
VNGENIGMIERSNSPSFLLKAEKAVGYRE